MAALPGYERWKILRRAADLMAEVSQQRAIGFAQVVSNSFANRVVRFLQIQSDEAARVSRQRIQ